MMNQRWRTLGLLLVALILLASSACQMSQKGRKPSADWSRGVTIGALVRGGIDLVSTPGGEQVHLVWLQEDEGVERVNYSRLGATGAVEETHILDLPSGEVRYPQIKLAGDNRLHLVWSSRSGGRPWELWYVALDRAGALAGEPVQLSDLAQDVRFIATAPDGQDGIYLAWDTAAGAISGVHLASDGRLLQGPATLVTAGQAPSLAVRDGDLHMSWMEGPDVYYGQFEEGRLETLSGAAVTTITRGTGQALDRPRLGLTDGWAYILWSSYSSTGLRAGTGVTEFIAFPRDEPQRRSPEMIYASPAEEQPYAPYDSAYQITQLAPPAPPAEATDFVREPAPAEGRADELAVAVALNQESRLDTFTQLGLLMFRDGAFAGYQMAARTDAFSQQPALAGDAAGNLYLAWREGGQGGFAYYALTAEPGRQVLDSFTGNDMAALALNGGIEVIAGMLFFPLACVWMAPGLLLLGLYHLWRGESSLRSPLTIALLIVAIIASQVAKFAFLPTMTTYTPFSSWVDVAPAWREPLMIAVPTLTMLAGLAVAFFMHRRTSSGLAFFFWFIATDALLTLAVYGVTFLGAF